MSTLNVAFCGDSSVGKTSIIYYFAHNSFDNVLQPTVAGAFKKEFIRAEDGHVITLEIWDTAGDERFSSVIPSFFKKSNIVVIVYDISKKASFEHLNYWIDIVQNNAPNDVRLVIIGNKSDIENREITLNELTDYAKKVNAFGFMETSAKTGEGVTELFTLVASADQPSTSQSSVNISDDTKSKKCC